MKNIMIKTLSIINFKGIKKQVINFNSITNIFGANASGKTTVFDAFTFLLFGKDSSDRKDFEIKPLDEGGNPKQKTENEVSAVLLVDGEEVELRHIMKEKWVKKRGSEKEEFSGNEHLYFWNDVPLAAGEYQAKINDILPEHIFKLLTNPLYFNSLKWQDRRTVLQEISGEVTDEDILLEKPEFAELIAELTGKTLKEFNAKNSADKKRIKDQLSSLPARIDELERSKPDIDNREPLLGKLRVLEGEYRALETQIEDRNEAHKSEIETVKSINNQIAQLEIENANIKNSHLIAYNEEVASSKSGSMELQQQINALRNELVSVNSSISILYSSRSEILNSHARNKSSLIDQESRINKSLEDLRARFVEINAKEIDQNSLVCSECNRPHEAHNIDELVAQFNQNKTKSLNGINEEGISLKKKLQDIQSELSNIQQELESALSAKNLEIEKQEAAKSELEEKISSLTAEQAKQSSDSVEVTSVFDRLLVDVKFKSNLSEIENLRAQLLNRPTVDISDLRNQKSILTGQIDALKLELSAFNRIQDIDVRIQEIKDQEKVLSQELALIERKEFLTQSYEKFKSEELERRVNGMFKYAKFKLFNQLVNGGEEPTCVTTYKGVPFHDLNNAAKILVGIDIINTLSEYYGISAPIWVDNRESITLLPDTETQLINLIVSPEDKKLRVA